jgi:hypothetical protein
MKHKEIEKESTQEQTTNPPDTPAPCAYYNSQLYSVGAFVQIPGTNKFIKALAGGNWQVQSP